MSKARGKAMPIADSPNRCTRSLRINCLEDYLNRRKKHLSDCAFSGLYVSGCTQPFMKCSLTIISNFTFELIYLKQTRKHAEDAAPGRPKVVAAIFWSLEPLVSERSCCSRIQGLISAKTQERAESISNLIIDGAQIPECSRQEEDRQS